MLGVELEEAELEGQLDADQGEGDDPDRRA